MKKVKRINRKLILGEGEITGHQHTIRDPKAVMYELDSDLMLLKLPRASVLRHERNDVPAEHRDIKLRIGEPIVSHKRQNIPDGWAKVED